jgi:hypothetical protein
MKRLTDKHTFLSRLFTIAWQVLRLRKKNCNSISKALVYSWAIMKEELFGLSFPFHIADILK